MILTKEQIKQRYKRTAPFYDLALGFYRLAGLTAYRRKAVEALRLQAGDTVVDMGCGTGANSRFLREAVGNTGRVIEVDLSGAMLSRARKRVERAGWTNVEFVEADLTEWQLPPATAGVLATFALEMVPEYDMVIKQLADNLAPGSRLSLLGLKYPEKWPTWLVTVGIWLNKPFGVSREYGKLHPWESVDNFMTTVDFQELYLGAAYRCTGEVRP